MKIVKTAAYLKKEAAWGKAGAGILFTCKEDGTAMLLFRSGRVEDPYMWGVPGGAVKGTEGYHDDRHAGAGTNFSEDELWDTAKGETVQELYNQDEHDFDDEQGLFPKQYARHPQMAIFDTNPNVPSSFKYYTFVVDIPLAEKHQMEKSATLNWENDEMTWVPLETLMQHIVPVPGDHGRLSDGSKLHKGVSHVLKTHPAFQPEETTPSASQFAPKARKPRAKKPTTDQNGDSLFNTP